jgi:nucleotide-binding universal stress UspA family protein
MSTIVVGVDGSESSQAALRFALDEARLRRATLRVVHVFVLPISEAAPDPFLLEFPSVPAVEFAAIADDLKSSAESLIDDALDKVLGKEAVDVTLERVAVEGSPAPALLDEAEGADLLVVGSRGHGRLREILLGSVSHECAQHATCPVAIVPARPPSEGGGR